MPAAHGEAPQLQLAIMSDSAHAAPMCRFQMLESDKCGTTMSCSTVLMPHATCNAQARPAAAQTAGRGARARRARSARGRLVPLRASSHRSPAPPPARQDLLLLDGAAPLELAALNYRRACDNATLAQIIYN